ncbi:MAG: hypothetical protein R3F14_29320 [Polyangiaceae bacterium]
MRHREEEQGCPATVWRLPPDLDREAARAFCDDVYDGPDVDEAEQPAYVLLLGDLDLLSSDLQLVLSERAHVGRLGFDRDSAPEQLAAYAEKVVLSERRGVRQRATPVFFATTDSFETRVGRQSLIEPCFERADRLARDSAAFSRPVLADTRRELFDETSKEARVLFTMSHGAGPPADPTWTLADGTPPRTRWPSYEAQRARQGILKLGAAARLGPAEIAGQPFLPEGAWLMFACYGAGTPRESAYRLWLDRLAPSSSALALSGIPASGDPPFIAALPKAALAKPDGPLGVIGHLDLAWSYSFADVRTASLGPGALPPPSRATRFHEVLNKLYRGTRMGAALSELLRHADKLDRALAALDRRREKGEPIDEMERARLWMQREDLSGFVLLGDPPVGRR